MTCRDIRPQAAQAPGYRVVVEIGAAHAKAEVEQNFGDAAHARAADAHEVNAFDLVLHAALASSTHTSATVRVASGLPALRACCAMPSSSSRVKPCSSPASLRGVSSCCGTSTAAPRSARKRALHV